MSGLRTTAAVLAGGVGVRAGLGIPKQLAELGGRSIIEHSIAAMQASSAVDDIIVMMVPGYLEEVRRIVENGAYDKVSAVLEGAGTRSATTVAALDALADDGYVLIHDAVRPLVSQTIIAANVAALGSYQAVMTAIPSSDTILQASGDGARMVDVLPRPGLRRAQTPQSFRIPVIRAAYAAAAADPGFVATDDCTVVLRYLPGVEIGIVTGEEHNIKITQATDVAVAEMLLRTAQRP